MAKVRTRVMEVNRRETEKSWKEKFNSKKGGYQMNKIRKMSKLIGETKKKIAGRFLQSNVEHALRGVYLEPIKKKESTGCWWCWHSTHTVDHMFK
jgi:hypothetical protein